MKSLRVKFCEFLQLRNLAQKTQESYLQAVIKLSKHYNESPELIGQEKIFQYIHSICKIMKSSPSARAMSP